MSVFYLKDNLFRLSPHIIYCRYSSFNDKPINAAFVGPIGKELFEKEQEDLLSDLKDIPKKACDRRVWSFSNTFCWICVLGCKTWCKCDALIFADK